MHIWVYNYYNYWFNRMYFRYMVVGILFQACRSFLTLGSLDLGFVHSSFLTLESLDLGVITEISSANGYRNPASSNSYEVTHGPKLPQKHFQKVQKYTISDKIKVCYDYTVCAHTCVIQNHRKSTHVHDARLWSLKAAHI
jgi:hypothetical protein